MFYPTIGAKVHQWAADAMLRDLLDEAFLERLKHYLAEADSAENSTIQNSYRHAMYGHTGIEIRAVGGEYYKETRAAAEARANEWVREQIELARNAFEAWKITPRGQDWDLMDASMRHLGHAMHCMQDATSPAHNDANGRFRRYRGGGKLAPEMHAHAHEEIFYPGYKQSSRERQSNPPWLLRATLTAFRYWSVKYRLRMPSNPVTRLGHDVFDAKRDWAPRDAVS